MQAVCAEELPLRSAVSDGQLIYAAKPSSARSKSIMTASAGEAKTPMRRRMTSPAATTSYLKAMRPREAPTSPEPDQAVKLTGLRSELYAAYAPVTLKAWLVFVQDCKVLTVPRSRSVQIFEAGLAEDAFVEETSKKLPVSHRKRSGQLAEHVQQEPKQVPCYRYVLIDSEDDEDDDDEDEGQAEEEKKEEDERSTRFHEPGLMKPEADDVEDLSMDRGLLSESKVSGRWIGQDIALVGEGGKLQTLSFEAFGFCVHKLAHLAYEHDARPCQTFSYLHLLPLNARKQIGFHVISFADAPVLRWLANADTRAGLSALFLSFAPRGGLGLASFRRLLRSLDLFPEYVSLVAVQDAFYETLQECSWEDAICNAGLQSQVFARTLDLARFTECLLRVMVKSDLFTKAAAGPGDLVPLLDRFLFPRRFLRNFKARKSSVSLQEQRRHSLSARKAKEGPPSAAPKATSSLKVPPRPEARPGDDAAAFGYFRDVCRDRRRRKVAQLEIYEFIHQFAALARRGLGWPGVLSKLRVGRSRRGSLAHKSTGRGAGFQSPVTLREVISVRKAVATVAKEIEDAAKLERETVIEREKASDAYKPPCPPTPEPPKASPKNQDGSPDSSKSSPPKRTAPTGFVSQEEHEIVLTKLKALEDALDLGDMDGLDWNGTLEDAETKMKDLIPKMMSEDPTESAAASDKFEMLDKIVRNHKDYKEREARQKQEWEDKNREINQAALEELREVFPQCIAKGAAMQDLREVFKLPAALAKRVFQRKALRLIHMEQEEIARMHIADLTGTFSTQGLDLRELRAVYASLPEEFGSDGDGKKAGWRESMLGTLQDMNKKLENGSLPKSQQRNPAYDAPVSSATAARGTAAPSPAGNGDTAKPPKPPSAQLSLAAAVAAKALAKAKTKAPASEDDAAVSRRQGVNSQDFFSELKRRASVIGTCSSESKPPRDGSGASPITLTKIAHGLKNLGSGDTGDDVEEVKRDDDGDAIVGGGAGGRRRATISSVSQLIKQCAKQSASPGPDEAQSEAPGRGHDDAEETPRKFETPKRIARAASMNVGSGGLIGELSAVLKMRSKSLSKINIDEV